MKKIYTLSLLLFSSVSSLLAQPTTAAPTPPSRSAANVISIYSDAYSNIPNVNYNPFWGQSGFGTASEITVSGDNIREYLNMNYQGIDFNTNKNVSSFDSVHFDVYSTNCTSLGITLVANGTGEREVTKALTTNSWNSIDIALSDYTSQGLALSAIFQFKFVSKTPTAGANVWIDNMYFYTNANLPTLANFSIPPVLKGAAPFAITDPVSNSTGAFTYTSSNPNVATISGNIITVLDAGTSTITATQAAAGGYSAGTITADLIVTVPPISTNAPNPTKPQSRVISLFSDVYNNVPVTDWRTSWSGAGPQTDTAITGNNIKKYEGVDYVGIEFPPIDVTLADSFHISVWTPSAQTFSVKLVNTGGGPANENIVHFSSRTQDLGLVTKYGPKPDQGQWNTYAIPLSLFATNNGGMQLTNRNSIFQMLFVGLNAPFSDNIYYVDNIYFSSTNNILPVKFTSISVQKTNDGAKLSWIAANQTNLNEYVIEKSLNGVEFTSIQNVKATNQDSYSFLDKNIVAGNNYYRIKAVDNDGKFLYSKTVSFNSKNEIALSIYPSPAKNQVVINNLTGNNNISIVNTIGQIVLQKSNVSTSSINVDISTLQNGVYSVIINNNGENKTLKLMVQK
ncbi:MAG: T9SS type A sorting domain-containing protein [Chitinophagaceae bacterium]